MEKLTTTYWIPLGTGRCGRVRIDVVEEALPVPLERPSIVKASDHELDMITRSLAAAEWLDGPPFPIDGLPDFRAAVIEWADCATALLAYQPDVPHEHKVDLVDKLQRLKQSR
jgi:hypothetical protein